MNKDDPLVGEVRATRDRHAASFGYDLKRIFQDIAARQAASGHVYVRFAPRPAAPAAARATDQARA